MATLLAIDDMNNEIFQAYYDCLCAAYSVAVADLVLGAPREVEIPTLDEDRLQYSYATQTCAVCDCGIPEDHKEDCTFEHLAEEVQHHEAHVFFLCDTCQ